MVNLSKYEEKLERRKNHNRGVTLKTSENLIRAFAGIAPPIKVIADIVFSLVDAKRDQAIDDFMDWAQERLVEHGIDIYKLGNSQKEIQESIKSQNLKIEDIQTEVIERYRNAEYFSKEERQKIIELLSEKNSILKSVNKKEDVTHRTLKSIEKKEDITHAMLDELIIRFNTDMINEELANKLLDEIEKKINTGELNKSLDQISSITNHKQFDNINDNLKVDFLSIYGKVLFDLVKKDDLKKIIVELLKTSVITKRKCGIIFRYSVAESKKDLFDIAISGYRIIGYEDSEIEVLSQYFNFSLGKTDKIIRALSYKSKSGEYIIKRKYQKFRKAYEYVGLTFFIKEDFANAKRFFVKADEIKQTLFYKFRILFCYAGMILSRIGSIKTLTDLEKQTLLDTYDGLTSEDIIKYFAERPSEISVEYWRIRLIIQMYLNKESALKEYDLIPIDVKKHPEIQLKQGDLILVAGKTEEAQLIYNKLYEKSKNPGILSRIFDCLIIGEKYTEILEMAKTIIDESYYESAFICKAIIAATFFTEGFKKANQLADGYLIKIKDPTILLYEIGHLNANFGQLDLAREYFEKCSDSIPKCDYPLRTEIARKCAYNGFDDLAIKVLKPFIKYNENGKKQYIDIILHFRKEKLYQEAEEIVDEELAKSIDREPWLKRKFDLENFQGHKNTALRIGEKIFELTKSPEAAYNLMILKSELGLSDFGKYSEILSVQKEPIYMMAAAICYKLDGNILLAKEFGYRALALDRSDFNEILFVQYVQLHLFSFPKEDLPKIERVRSNTSVHLKNGEDLLWITIDSDKTLFSDLKPFKFAGSVHYHEEHDDVIELLDKNLGEKVKIGGEEYEITEIIPNYVSAFRYCLEKYTKNVPDSDFIWSIPVNLKNPFQSIIPELEAMRKSDLEMIKRYNNIKELGMPLWILAQKKNRSLADAMIFIIEKHTQPYYTGEIRRFDFKNINIVLSPMSILILSFLDKLIIITSNFKLFITQSTKDYFRSSIQNSRKDENTSAILGINDDGRPFYEEMKEENWKKRKGFLRSIYDLFKQMNIQNIELSPEELDNKKTIIDLIGKPDYESILLSKEVGGIYIADDLFLRKVFRMIHQNNMHSNSISFLFEHYLNNIGEFVEIQKKLSEWDYQYLYNAEMIIDTVEALNNQFQIIGPGTAYDSFETVVHNSMRTHIGFSIYEKELLSAIFALYDFRRVPNYEYCFRIILKKIVMYYSFFRNDVLILKAKIKFLLGKYPLRKRYFLDLLEDELRIYGKF